VAIAHETAQGAQHLILAAEVPEFARQEHVIARLAGNPLLNLLS
jgi:hypothetical protein